MKLFLYEQFLESYSKLPKQTQKKVQDFIKKFKEDSTRPSIHLEPINTFKDQQLRTARVDQKYRAIIHVATKGELFHLLWVDNHDEAMDWAQNKVFNWNQHGTKETFCGQFSDEDLLTIGIPYPLLPSVKMIDTLDDLERMESYLPREAFESLYYLIDGLTIDEIIAEIDEGKLESDKFELQLNSANNQRSFIDVSNDKDVEELLNGDLSKWKIFLHPSQRSVVENNYKGSFKVSGAAGTGKTVVALHRLNYMSKQEGIPKGSIFFTTFTKSLVGNLKVTIRDLNVNREKVVIDNIHNFVMEDAKHKKLIEPDAKIIDFLDIQQKEELWKEVIEFKLSEFDLKFLMREYEDVILINNISSLEEYLTVPRIGTETPLGRKARKKIWDIFNYFEKFKSQSRVYYLDEVTNKLTHHYTNQTQKPFQHIIADEIQDFSNVELCLLRAMVEEKENDLFLVGDPLQKIYKRYISFGRSGINIRGKRSKRLKVNYRTTEEIKRSATAVIKNISFDDFDGSEEEKKGYVSILHGEKPSYEILKSYEDMNRKILDIIQQDLDPNQIQYNEICIGARTKKIMSEAKTVLHQKQIPYFDVTNQSGDRNGINLSTFHNMKGLEFKSVILYDVSQNTVPCKFYGYEALSDMEQKNYLRQEKALLYVAMSRAIKELNILGCGSKSRLVNLG
jgi:superfamily I DNA/RNA helicase/mRNA-degrading endonuclease RelE of RelBE toxin-antitoxin system